MAEIIYGKKIQDIHGGRLDKEFLRNYFADAAELNRRLLAAGLKVAYNFIDPLLHYFEAGNQFYFEVLECPAIPKLNYYRTGAGPVHALADAQELIDCGLYDVVLVFGYEPLMSNKQKYGRETVSKAMDIFGGGISLVECYNGLGRVLCREYGLSPADFAGVADALYENYGQTFNRVTGAGSGTKTRPRGDFMTEAGSELFRLTDCANPNVDFAGGVMLGNERAAEIAGLPREKRVRIAAVSHEMVRAAPEQASFETIAGTKEAPFPHVARMLKRAEALAGLSLAEALAGDQLLLEVYTCYPPIPLGFLLAGGFVQEPRALPAYLADKEITVTGGLSLGRAPWNNPVLSSLVTVSQQLPGSGRAWGLVHGNGGIGESQGVVILACS